MSSTPLDLPILIAQLPYVAKIAHAEKATPDIQKQLFGPLINEHIRKNQSKVQQVEKKQETAPIDRDGKQNQQQAQPERKQKEKEDKEEAPESGSSTLSPWSGNIINVKI